MSDQGIQYIYSRSMVLTKPLFILESSIHVLIGSLGKAYAWNEQACYCISYGFYSSLKFIFIYLGE